MKKVLCSVSEVTARRCAHVKPSPRVSEAPCTGVTGPSVSTGLHVSTVSLSPEIAA